MEPLICGPRWDPISTVLIIKVSAFHNLNELVRLQYLGESKPLQYTCALDDGVVQRVFHVSLKPGHAWLKIIPTMGNNVRDDPTELKLAVTSMFPFPPPPYHSTHTQISRCDAVFTIGLHGHIASKLEECRLLHGPLYGQLVGTIDPSVREQLLQFVSVDLVAVVE